MNKPNNNRTQVLHIIGKKIRQTFTKVLAVDLAIFLMAPVVQNFVPQVKATKVSEKTANVQNPVLTVNVSFFSLNGDKLLYDGQEQVEFRLSADEINHEVGDAISERFDLGKNVSIELNGQGLNFAIFSATFATAKIHDGDNIKVTIFNYDAYSRIKNPIQEQRRLEKERLEEKQKQKAIQHRQQRSEETLEAKNERKNRQNELRRKQEAQERTRFRAAKISLKRTIENIAEERPKLSDFNLRFIDGCCLNWIALQQGDQSLAELFDQIAFELFSCEHTAHFFGPLVSGNLIQVYGYNIRWFIDFFKEIKSLNISNLEEFSSYYHGKLESMLCEIIKNHSYHKEIILFRNSLDALIYTGFGLKKDSSTGDLKSNLASLRRVNRDFRGIVKDEFLKIFSAPIIEAVDRIIEESETILKSRAETGEIPTKAGKIPIENLSSQRFVQIPDDKNRYMPSGEQELYVDSEKIMCPYLDTQTGRKVAIKVNYYKDFSIDEFEKLSEINSPHVVKIIDLVTFSGCNKKHSGMVMEYVEDGIPLKRYVYNLTDNRKVEKTLELCIQLIKGAIELSNHGVCDLYFRHTNNVLVNKDGHLKYVYCDDQIFKTNKEAAKSNFDPVKNMVFDILKFNFPTTLYKKLLEKMGYILKIKEERSFPKFDFFLEGVLYNPEDVVEVSSDLHTLLSKLEELQSENCSVIQKTQ